MEESTKISHAIDMILCIFKVDPSHWPIFARISTFDRQAFDKKLVEVAHELFYIQHFCQNSDDSRSTDLDEDYFFKVLVEESLAAALSNIEEWKKTAKENSLIKITATMSF